MVTVLIATSFLLQWLYCKFTYLAKLVTYSQMYSKSYCSYSYQNHETSHNEACTYIFITFLFRKFMYPSDAYMALLKTLHITISNAISTWKDSESVTK